MFSPARNRKIRGTKSKARNNLKKSKLKWPKDYFESFLKEGVYIRLRIKILQIVYLFTNTDIA